MRRVAILLCSCLALTACGGGDGAGGGESSQFQRAIEPEARERAESMVLKGTDFPAGWQATAADEDEEGGDEAFNDCVGVDYSEFTIVGEAQSDDFSLGETSEASSEAEVFETEEMAAEAVARFAEALSGDEADACFSESLGTFDDEQVEIVEAELGELDFAAPAGVDDANAWQLVITVEGKAGTQAAGVSVTAYVDFLQVRKEDATAEVTALDVQGPFDPELRDELVGAVAERMGEPET